MSSTSGSIIGSAPGSSRDPAPLPQRPDDRRHVGPGDQPAAAQYGAVRVVEDPAVEQVRNVPRGDDASVLVAQFAGEVRDRHLPVHRTSFESAAVTATAFTYA